MTENCRGCLYWFRRRSDPKWREREDSAYCRRYAPVPCTDAVAGAGYVETTWPMTLADDWCGEWTPTPARIKNE